MEKRRHIDPVFIPGQSVTRMHLESGGPFPGPDTEIHVSHYPDGDITEEAQWYGVYEHPTEFELELMRETLHIDEEDWKIVMHLLGSFKWAMVEHDIPPVRNRITVDESAMRAGEWTTTYF